MSSPIHTKLTTQSSTSLATPPFVKFIKGLGYGVMTLLVWAVFSNVALAAGGAVGEVAQTSAYGVHVTLLIVFVLMSLFVSFICSVSEATLLTMTPSYVASIQEEEPKKSALLQNVKIDNIDQSIAAILTLNTVAHTVGSLGAGAQATIVFGSEWFGVFSAVMTLLVLVCSEIIPKTMGTVYWRRLSGPVAYFVKGTIFMLYPLIWLSEKITRMLTRGHSGHTFSRNEFAALASVGEKSGQIDPLESRIIRNLLAFGAIKVEDIMTPRSVMLAFDASMSVAQLLADRPKLTFSRLPIYDKDLDNITGFVLKTDLLLAKANHHTDKPLQDYQREVTFVFSKMKLFDLLDLMLKHRIHIAITVGEYGEVKGLVTLEDVLETLLGLEIVDEIDRVEDMQELAKQMMEKRSQRLGMLLEQDARHNFNANSNVNASEANASEDVDAKSDTSTSTSSNTEQSQQTPTDGLSDDTIDKSLTNVKKSDTHSPKK